ncbi:SDR family NAD(P)-dependent oxidoreductase [Achromobacter piechaudii]|uniref:3-oxoacyl-[acyl-carrier-protein] reductase FabG n=1 Tax=Achromobacter piechaudii TaxID=72556 RepID=A0ABN7F6A9_9BURK|nr:SDR family oxidoreductase [Achromobacter piechaudii]CAB3735464.1 3-oxoacyl-[acyl-carrier-protein] reductase FabG [Achromobacter piechaudii]CAB3916844.1 3-oxoacyl-[acyl-carrier-protein] reductase FabG [Achromobacter piechaudii]CAB3955576.1 3-oxoacyl-[acyl-carrier-protein] reductase FabG [Achromobacter piechaudii]
MSNERNAGLAVVTGASGGIGLAIAQRLLQAGWRVAGLDIGPAAVQHAAYRHVTVDLCDADATGAALEMLKGGGAQVDALVHAAGILRVGPLAQLDPLDGERMWKLHVDVAVRLAQVLAPEMATRGAGRVVLVGSRVAQGMPGRSQYAASKAALVALARSWAAELAPQGVTVNVVSPAATQTGMLQDPARAASAPRLPPIGRLIQPEEIAALVQFLLSPEAAAITGQDIAICGGASLPR